MVSRHFTSDFRATFFSGCFSLQMSTQKPKVLQHIHGLGVEVAKYFPHQGYLARVAMLWQPGNYHLSCCTKLFIRKQCNYFEYCSILSMFSYSSLD